MRVGRRTSRGPMCDEDPHEEGRTAFKNGLPMDDNPYTPCEKFGNGECSNRYRWFRGWLQERDSKWFQKGKTNA